jgi:hypothetical protein
MGTYNTFRHISNIGDVQFTDRLANSAVAWMNDAFLNIGGFTSLSGTHSLPYGGSPTRLRYVNDLNFSSGQVWEGYRQNWVYETNVEYAYQPISISGVYVGGIFRPTTGVGPYAHSINYPYGQVVFTSGISISSVVTCEHSFRDVNVYTNDVPWFREVMFGSMRPDNAHFLQNGSGIWHTLAQNRVQLPALIVEPTSNVSFRGRELGGTNIRYQAVLIHVLAETPSNKNALADILLNQKDQVFFTIDYDLATLSGVLPLDYRGMKRESGLNYGVLMADGRGYRHRRATIVDCDSVEIASEPLFRSVVRWTCEVDI